MDSLVEPYQIDASLELRNIQILLMDTMMTMAHHAAALNIEYHDAVRRINLRSVIKRISSPLLHAGRVFN